MEEVRVRYGETRVGKDTRKFFRAEGQGEEKHEPKREEENTDIPQRK